MFADRPISGVVSATLQILFMRNMRELPKVSF